MIRVLSVISSLLFIISCTENDPYKQGLIEQRQKKDTEFRNEKTSPLSSEHFKSFEGLKYFPVNPDFKIEGKFTRIQSDPFQLPHTQDTSKEYVRFGEIEFQLSGKNLKLSVYQNPKISLQPEHKDYLFIPFTDLTNGDLTYGGGRYLDFKIPGSEKVTLDFNLAYNPYCAYSDDYTCPIPPKENDLDIEIKAGEKYENK